MLHISIHDRDVWGRRSEHSFNARGGQTPSSDPMHAPYAEIVAGHLADQCSGAVPGIVVDKDNLPGDIGKSGVEQPTKRRNVIPLFQRWYNDRQLGRIP